MMLLLWLITALDLILLDPRKRGRGSIGMMGGVGRIISLMNIRHGGLMMMMMIIDAPDAD